MLSALLPLGMPQSTALGSAFNPAATAVAIKAGSGQLRIVAKAAAKDDDTAPRDGPSWAAVCGASTPRFSSSPSFSGACRRLSDPAARGAEIWPVIYARGPPTA
nr:hypothetical protein [Sphingomonas colocasiae]